MKGSVRRTVVIVVALVVIVTAAIAVVLRPKPAASAGPPPEVMVVPVVQKDVALYSEWIGTLDGLVNADVKAQSHRLLAAAGLSGRRVRSEGPTPIPD